MKTLRVVLVALLAAVLTIGVSVPAAEAAKPATPTGLKVLSTSTKAVSVGWKSVSGASRYRVQYATSTDFSGAKSASVDAAAADVGGLSAGTTYYLRVRVIDADGGALSNYSTTLKVKTRASGYTQLAPRGLKATASKTTSVTLGWSSRGGGIRYRISYATKSSFADAVYRRQTSTSQTLTGLRPNTTYYVKVRVITADGGNLSAYSPAITVKTAAIPAPKGLKVTATSTSALAVNWTTVSGAERYRIQYAKKSSMAGAKYARFSGGSAELTGLSGGTTYYLKIRVITPSGINLGPYSSAVKASTATASTPTHLPPSGLTASASAPGKLSVSWKSRGSGLRYQVQSSTNAAMSNPKTLTSSGTTATVSGLAAATTYHLRVRVVTAGGAALSGYSPTKTAKTRSDKPVELRVASYNVTCANCFAGRPNEGTWYERRDAVVATVKAQKADVIGFQEASQGWLKDSAGKPVSKAQFEDLVERLGSPYKVTNKHRNNCVKSTTPTNCVYQDQGASQGTKIVYNSARLTLVSEGSKRLAKVKETDPDRYVAWAILEDKDSGRRFLFANTHLEHHADAGGSSAYFDLRVTQTREAVALINAKRQGMPVYFVGDFNSHKWTVPANGPYDVLAGAGFIDPLGNTYRSTKTTKGAIVEKRIRTNFSSFNNFAAKAPSFSYTNGTYLDYIWVSAGIDVPEWETVVKVDANNHFVGRIPADHNMIRVTTRLP